MPEASFPHDGQDGRELEGSRPLPADENGPANGRSPNASKLTRTA
jgi:hypothetical protein